MAGPAPDLTGRVAVLTGATRGIGRAAAEALGAMGATLVLLARRPEDGERVAAAVRARRPAARVDVVPADLASLASIREAAERVAALHPAVHVLVNNAAAAGTGLRRSADGIELQLAVNHVAPFWLTHLLAAPLLAAGDARVVTTSSEAHQSVRTFDVADPTGVRAYNGLRAYAATKLLNVLFTAELARRLEGTGVTANCLHPGVVATGLVTDYAPALRWLVKPLVSVLGSTEAQAADTIVWLASSDEVAGRTGRYWKRRREKAPSLLAQDRRLAEDAWAMSERLCGLAPGSAFGRRAADRP